jgi:D-threonate/D-erythronate kinase
MSGPTEGGILTIIADDLTGALDTAGPFALADAPIAVVSDLLEDDGASAARLAVSTESRYLDRSAAVETARAIARTRLKLVGRHGLWFKKVDSVLRGHPFDETLAVADAVGFERIVFAPAFPEQERRTVRGRQEARTPEGWMQVGEDLLAGFRARGVAAARTTGRRWPKARVAVLDASDPADLDRIARELWSLIAEEPVLVAGCGGLAEAMAGRLPPQAFPPPDILVIGSPHPVMKAQIAAALDAGLLAHAPAPAGPHPPPRRELPLLFVPDESIDTRAAAERCLVQAIERLVEQGNKPRRLFVSGGATLSLVAMSTGSRGIRCIGRVAPGLPCSRLTGGAWDGCQVVSKSGGFGSKNLLTDLLRQR